MMIKKKNNPQVIAPEVKPSETETASELAAIKAAVEALTPKSSNPPATVFCDVERRTYLVLDTQGNKHLREIFFEGKRWGNACGPCTNFGDNTDLEDIADYLACHRLGFAKGTRLQSAGLVLLPYILAKVPYSRITQEQLIRDFDRHPRFSNKPKKALVPGPIVRVVRDSYNPDTMHTSQYEQNVQLAKFLTEAGFDVDNPGRSNYRPLLPSEREDQEIEQLEATFAAKVTQNESRKMHLDRRIVALEQARAEIP